MDLLFIRRMKINNNIMKLKLKYFHKFYFKIKTFLFLKILSELNNFCRLNKINKLKHNT